MDMKTKTPLIDVKTLRENARKHVDDGAVTTGYAAADEFANLLHRFPADAGDARRDAGNARSGGAKK